MLDVPIVTKSVLGIYLIYFGQQISTLYALKAQQ